MQHPRHLVLAIGVERSVSDTYRQLSKLVTAIVEDRFGAFVPRDGEDGQDGKDFEPEAVRYIIEEAVAALPPPVDALPPRQRLPRVTS